MTRSNLYICLIISFCLALPASNNYAQNLPLKKINFLPLWVPQPQFAGYYMAKEKGIYQKYGLDVNLISGGYHRDVIEYLQNGQADIGLLFLYSGVMKRAKGVKIVNIGQVFQRSGIMFLSKKKSGIKSLQDFNGKRIGLWRTVLNELTEGFINKHKISAEIIPFNKGVNLFLKDAIDITVAMDYNEYKTIINHGINENELNKFYFFDYDMNFPEDGIYCLESVYQKDPEMCRKFVAASLEGWQYALNNEEETLNVISKYREMEKYGSNRSHLEWMLNCMKDMINSSDKAVSDGVLLERDYDYLVRFLLENKYIETKPPYNDFYKGSR